MKRPGTPVKQARRAGPAGWQLRRTWAAPLLALLATGGATRGAAAQLHVDWVPSPDRGRVIVNVYRMEGREAGPVDRLLIERDPAAAPEPRLYSETGRFYATVESAAFRNALQGSALRAILMQAAAMAQQGVDQVGEPLPGDRVRLRRPEWAVLLNSLLQDSFDVGAGPERVVIRQLRPEVQERFRAEIEDLFRSESRQPLLPHIPGRVALVGGVDDANKLTFTTTRVGEEVTDSIRLANLGLKRIMVTPALIPANSGFALSSSDAIPLLPGDTESVALAFKPRQEGTQGATVRFVSGSRGSLPAAVATLEGTGGEPSPGWREWVFRVSVGGLVLVLLVLSLLLFFGDHRDPNAWKRTGDGSRSWWLPFRHKDPSPGLQQPVTNVYGGSGSDADVRPGPPPPPPPNNTRREVGEKELDSLAETIRGFKEALAALEGDVQATKTFRVEMEEVFADLPPSEEVPRGTQLVARARSLKADQQRLTAELLRVFPEARRGEGAPSDEELLEHVRTSVQRLKKTSEEADQLRKDLQDVQARYNEEKTRSESLGRDLRAAQAKERELAEQNRELEQSTRKAESDRRDAEGRLRTLTDDHDRLKRDRDTLAGDREKLEGEKRAMATFLRLPEGASSAEIQRTLHERTASQLPSFVLHFRQLLRNLETIVRKLERAQSEDVDLRRAANSILSGDKGDAGIRGLLAQLESPERFQELLGLERSSDLWDLPRERFYERVIDPYFLPILNAVTRVSLYAKIRRGNVDVAQKLADDLRVDPRYLDRAYGMIELYLEEEFRMSLRTVRLFEDRFTNGEHETARHHVILQVLPYLSNAIYALAPETIYDIASVGYSMNGVEVKPCVSYVTPR